MITAASALYQARNLQCEMGERQGLASVMLVDAVPVAGLQLYCICDNFLLLN